MQIMGKRQNKVINSEWSEALSVSIPFFISTDTEVFKKNPFLNQRHAVSNGILLENTYFMPKLKQFWLFHSNLCSS